MSVTFKHITGADTMPSHVETRSRIFGRPFGKTAFHSARLSQDCNLFAMQLGSKSNVENTYERRPRTPVVRSTIMGMQSRLNQNLTSNDHVNKSTAPKSFGLCSRISSSVPSIHDEDSLRLNQITNNVLQKDNICTISRTFGLVPENLNSLSLNSNEMINQELRRNNNVDSFIMPRPLGLQIRNIPSHSQLFSQDNYTVNQGNNGSNYRSNINGSAISRVSCLNSENVNGLNLHDNGGLNQGSRENLSYSFGIQSRNVSLHSGLLPERDLRLNQNSNQRSNGIATVSKTFGPAVGSFTLSTGSQVQDGLKYNDDVTDNCGFRRPNISRIIRGRNSTLSSRLFHNQNTSRHCKDLSNINGFNVSHISRRDMDTLSESRLALNMRSRCMDNQSIAGSILSTTSMKSQFLNLLENLHHSILNIGPNVTAEAVRMEFDRAKQRLENISEMSFAPSINEAPATSANNRSSKYICPQISEPSMTKTIDGGSLNLKSSKDLLKTLIPGINNYKKKFDFSTYAEDRGKTSSRKSEFNNEQDSDLLFKKPRSYIKRKKSPRNMKIKTPQAVKSITSKATNKVINLKQWYPIAVGSDLAFCGVDDQGAVVKTDAVKKRLNSRKIELVNGCGCNLIGSPSATVSVLPKKIMNLLKNGLTDRWRVLQKELLNCQTAEEESKKRKSRSPRVKGSPERQKGKSPESKTKKGKFKSPKVISTPKKRDKGMLTRSGRIVKPPTMFWLATGSNEVTSSLAQQTLETTPSEILPKKKSKKTPVKKEKKSSGKPPNRKAKTLNDSAARKCKKRNEESLTRKAKVEGHASSKAKKAVQESFKNLRQKPSKVKSPMDKRKESEEEVKVHSSTADAKRQIKNRQSQGKRKREVTVDSDCVLAKKSKLEGKVEIEVESTLKTAERVNKNKKKKKNKLPPRSNSSKTEAFKSPLKKKNDTIKKKKGASKNLSESKKETKEIVEFEEDFELKLDDIEIPEITNISGNPQLSRSQLRLVCTETPPLKYFNSNLKLLRSATPVRSPDWCLSQRTESEVKQFQRRREEAFKKKKITVDLKKTVTKKTENVQNKDVKRMMEWVAEKTVRSPQWNSKLLQYVLPSRKRRMEQQDDEEEEEEEEDIEIGF